MRLRTGVELALARVLAGQDLVGLDALGRTARALQDEDAVAQLRVAERAVWGEAALRHLLVRPAADVLLIHVQLGPELHHVRAHQLPTTAKVSLMLPSAMSFPPMPTRRSS